MDIVVSMVSFTHSCYSNLHCKVLVKPEYFGQCPIFFYFLPNFLLQMVPKYDFTKPFSRKSYLTQCFMQHRYITKFIIIIVIFIVAVVVIVTIIVVIIVIVIITKNTNNTVILIIIIILRTYIKFNF